MPYAKTPEGLKKKKEYEKNTPKEVKMFRAARHRAKMKSIDFTISLSDIVIPKYCPITGIELRSNEGGNHPIKSSPNLDRIDNRLGYVPGNVAVISSWANQRKGDLTVEEITKLYEYVTKKE